MSRPTDERGQVLSSLVAVLAVVAIVAGLLVLFGTRGGDSTADQPSTATTPKPSTKPATGPTTGPTTGPSTIVASVPKPGESETPVPPTTEPTSAPTEPPSSEPTTTAPPPATEPAIPPAERPAVEVYNNTGRKGLADSVAGRARQAGWTVAGADNWHGKIAESTVYYPPGMLDAANQLARDLGISRTKGALDNMKKDRLTVILTSDYTG
jgi:LytR cell envelope-related transcriptional attenuator